MRKQFGIITPAISPFREEGIDDEAVSRLVRYARKIGVRGIFPAGSTGCAPLMSVEQHIGIIRAYADENVGSMKLFPGIGRNSVSDTLTVAKTAIKAGCDAVVLVTPYYLLLDRAEITRYYDILLDKIDHDVIVYNIPQLTGNGIDAVMVMDLRKRHRNLVGVKDSSKNAAGFSELCRLLPEEMLVFQGEDDLLLWSLKEGASGGVCGTTNFTDLAVRVYDSHASRKAAEARMLQALLTRVMSAANELAFPSNYNYLFYRTVMGRGLTNVVPPLAGIADKEGDGAYKRIQGMLNSRKRMYVSRGRE